MRTSIIVEVAFIVGVTLNGMLAADETQSVQSCTCEIACNEVQMEYQVHNWYHFCWQAADEVAADSLSETAELDEELMAFLLWYWFGASE